jgi:DNA-binding NtrC family response regulator
MERARVLVVEDRESVLKVIATILERGYEVTTAPDGAMAIARLGAETFDVVLTDIRMPGASGFDVLRAVQARAPRTAVVMMTAYANVPDAVAAMKLGAYDYVAKPLEADEVLLVVARAVDRLRNGQAAARGETAPRDLSLGFHRAVEEARDRASREYLVNLMRVYRGNVTHAATQAGMTRESLHRVLRRYGVRTEPHRAPNGEADESGPGPLPSAVSRLTADG